MPNPDTQTPLPSLAGLVQLCHHRWLVPVIAEIGVARGERVATLRAGLNISGSSIRRTIAVACNANLVMPNPGYGHPLRPEYLLTPWGEGLARECLAVIKIARAHKWTELTARKWSLPVLAAITAGCSHYSDIARALPSSTPRALSLALNELAQAGCVTRTLVDGRPPRSVYAVNAQGRRLARAAAALAAVSNLA